MDPGLDRVEGDVIKEVHSFYDTAAIREVLSPADQASLDSESRDEPGLA